MRLLNIVGQRSMSPAYWVNLALKRPQLGHSSEYQDETIMWGIIIAMLLRQSKPGSTVSFYERLMPHLAAILDGCKIGSSNLAADCFSTSQIMLNTIIFAMMAALIASHYYFEIFRFQLRAICWYRGWWCVLLSSYMCWHIYSAAAKQL